MGRCLAVWRNRAGDLHGMILAAPQVLCGQRHGDSEHAELDPIGHVYETPVLAVVPHVATIRKYPSTVVATTPSSLRSFNDQGYVFRSAKVSDMS